MKSCTHLDVSVAALILKNVAFASLATALAYRQKQERTHYEHSLSCIFQVSHNTGSTVLCDTWQMHESIINYEQ